VVPIAFGHHRPHLSYQVRVEHDAQQPPPTPVLSVTPLTLDFGAVPVGRSASLSFHVANPGTAALEVMGLDRTGASFALSHDSTPFLLPPGAPGEPIVVDFQPDTAGAFSGTVTVQSNAGSAQVTLQGIGESPPVARTRLYFIHNDHLGTPQFLTDETATLVWRARYKPFGQAEVDEDPDKDGKQVTFNLRFPGQYYDAETGLHYNYARYYDLATGRYITPDPVGLPGG
jgi:RHS repeat-associated protein